MRINDVIKKSRCPRSLFAVYFAVMLLMSLNHTLLVRVLDRLGWNDFSTTLALIIFWALISALLGVVTNEVIKRTYEMPTQKLARAMDKVAHGDFTIHVEPLHSPDEYDYFDLMILDFNKMVQELGSIETLRTDFFTNVSHEIKAPLAVIHNNAQLLSAPGLTEERIRGCTENILIASRRLTDLITNMLKLNKLENQAISPIPRCYDVCEQLTECIFQFEEQLDDKDIELEADLDERSYVEADPGLMELVWTNLLSNAVKFTPAGGRITVARRSLPQGVEIRISDTGCGIAPEIQTRIFDKFYQGDTSHSTEGNGLGLALVKRILELSEGSIAVDSTPGKGTEFTVILPPGTVE